MKSRSHIPGHSDSDPPLLQASLGKSRRSQAAEAWRLFVPPVLGLRVTGGSALSVLCRYIMSSAVVGSPLQLQALEASLQLKGFSGGGASSPHLHPHAPCLRHGRGLCRCKGPLLHTRLEQIVRSAVLRLRECRIRSSSSDHCRSSWSVLQGIRNAGGQW